MGTESLSPPWVFPVMLCTETLWLVHLWCVMDSLEEEACERRGLAFRAWAVPGKEGQLVGMTLRIPHSCGPGGPDTTELVIQSQWIACETFFWVDGRWGTELGL